MEIHQFFIILSCYIFIFLCNDLTAQTVGTDIKLKIEYGDGKEYKNEPCPVKSSEICVLGQVYEKLKMKCRAEPALNGSRTLAWFKFENNKSVKLTESKRLKISDGDIEFSPLFPDDVGQYQCKVANKGQEDLALTPLAQIFVELGASPLVVPMFKDLTVVEENTINVTCTVVGKASRIRWTFGNDIIGPMNSSRIEVKEFNGVPDATLLIKNASTVTDRGQYNCTAETSWGLSNTHGSCYVRVKSKYAALGPFLGICAEVIILCTIILIYEKKRDKTELEESDTDQGPETKSSPDHGQDSVRYRK